MTQSLMGLRLPTSNIGFDESYYLSANPDVAALVQQGVYPSGRAHYEELGRMQGREPLQGGNQGTTLARGIQNWRQALGTGSGMGPTTPTVAPTTPAVANNPFITAPPAAAPSDGSSGLGGTGATGDGDGRGGYGAGPAGTPGSTSAGNRDFSAGRLGSMAGTVLGAITGVPALGLGLGALGTYADVNALNDVLTERNMPAVPDKTVSFKDAFINNTPLGYFGFGRSAQSQFQDKLEMQREFDRAMGFARGPSTSTSSNDSPDDVDSFGSQAAATAAENAQAARDAAAQQDAAEGGGRSSDNSGAAGAGLGDNGASAGGYDAGAGGYTANGGHIRRRFAAGGLNIQPWDRIDADVDKRGLTSVSAFESAGYAYGGLTQPGSNPIHAALGTQVRGPGDGRSDDIPAMLSNDEYVIPADVVAALGDGSSNAGAKKLADLVVTTRARYRKKLGSLPPPKA